MSCRPHAAGRGDCSRCSLRLQSSGLAHYNVTMDFPNTRIYLSERKSLMEPDRRHGSRLHLMRRGGQTVVDAVDKESAREKTGIRVGDELRRVADRNTSELRLYE